MADTPLAVMKRIAEKLGYAFKQAEHEMWFFSHDSVPDSLSTVGFPTKREAYRAALRDYYDANLGNITLEGL